VCFFASLIHMFLILPASVFVASLVLEMFSKLIFFCSIFFEVFDLAVFFRALEVAQEIRSSKFRLVISTQWLRPTPRIALAQV
jgi:hypothetical protein